MTEAHAGAVGLSSPITVYSVCYPSVTDDQTSTNVEVSGVEAWALSFADATEAELGDASRGMIIVRAHEVNWLETAVPDPDEENLDVESEDAGEETPAPPERSRRRKMPTRRVPKGI